MLKPLPSIAALAPLAGCVKPATYQQACSSYGFTPGTDAFAGCVQREAQAAQARTAAFYQDLGNQMQQSRPKTCNTSGTVYGSSYSGSTTCY